MKEVTRISLAALPYNVEVDAKKELEKYLHAVEKSLNADADAMKEIEARIAELLADRGVTGEKVIARDDVQHIRERLGEPKDFVDEDGIDAMAHVERPSSTAEKSLMRDTNDQVLGGVCSGLAAYLHVDVVWVRLAMVVLGVVTSGAMVLVYLAMWLIMPPARTAAERLQMKGLPVTLEAIQDESVVVAQQNNQRQIVLTIARIVAGAGALIVAAAALVGLGATIYHTMVATETMRLLEPEEKVYFGLLVVAGLAFIVFCIIIARALFMNRYSKRFWVTIAALTVLGLGLFTTGALGIRYIRGADSELFNRQQIEQRVDATAVRGAKQLKVKANMPITVRYTVDPVRADATVHYSKYDADTAPTVTLVRDGDVLTVNLTDNEKSCPEGNTMCVRRFAVDIVGPALNVVEGRQDNDIIYHTISQKSLEVLAADDSNVTIESDSLIDRLSAKVTKRSTASFLPASIATLTIATEGSESAALVANVNQLNLTIPEACSLQTGRAMVNISHADSITVNGAPYHDDIGYPCTTIRFIPNGEQ